MRASACDMSVSPAANVTPGSSSRPLRRQPVLSAAPGGVLILLLVCRHEGAVDRLEGIACQGLEVTPDGGMIAAAQGAGKRCARAGQAALDRFQVRQNVLASHAELAI